jgi:2-methylcitrate dehydratase
MKTTQDLADYAFATRFEDLDPAVVERVKDLSISALGSAVLGARMRVTEMMVDYAAGKEAPAQATVIGSDLRTSAEWASVLNNTASHCTELEDVAWPDATYSCFLFPSTFTLAETFNADGRALIEALAVGFELASRPGVVLADAGGVARGWLTGALLGTVGVAAAASKLKGHDRATLGNSIAVAASFGAGLNRQTGSGAHVIEPGFAGRNGLMAAELAERGLTGNPTIMEGRAGYWDAIAGQPDIDFEFGSGRDMRIMAIGMKKYPCCYLTQRIIDGLFDVMAENGLGADDVVRVEVGVNRTFPQILKYPTPRNAEEARFSLPHIVSAVLNGETLSVDTFTDEKVRDPRLLAHHDKVVMTVHDDWGSAQLGEKNTLTVTTRDGRTLERECRTARGDPSHPLSREELIDRFLKTAGPLMRPGKAEQAIEGLTRLETQDDLARLMPLFGGRA